MRKRITAVLLIALAVVSCSCSRSGAEEYADFMSNSDVLMRFELCFADVRNGRAGGYTIGELETLREDLEEGYLIDDAQAEKTTELFQAAADALAEAIRTSPDDPQSSRLYEQARALFDEGWRLSVRIRSGAPPE